MPSYTTGTASLEIDRHALSDNRNSKPVNSNNNETHDTDGVAMLNRNFEQQDTICSQSDFQEDSKQGWLCVAAGWCIFFVYMGLTYSYGIVQLHLANRNFADVPTLSYVGSIAAAISPFGAILTQKIMGRIGYRWSAAIGGTLLGLGEFAAGFSLKSLPGFFITQGVVFGIGAGLCFLPAATAPALYFDKRKGLATGIVYSGAGAGAAVMSLVLDKLIEVVEIENTLIIMGCIAWAICIPSAALLPGRSKLRSPTNSFQLHYFRQGNFWLLLLMSAIAVFPTFVPPFLLPIYASSVGISNANGALVLSVWNIASGISRVVMGFGADSVLGPTNSLLLCQIIFGLSTLLLWPNSRNLGSLLAFGLINGAGSGAFFSLMPVVVARIYGSSKLTSVLSVIVTSWGFGYIMGAPIAGFIYNAYGGVNGGDVAFRAAIFYTGGVALVSCVLLIILRLRLSREIFSRL